MGLNDIRRHAFTFLVLYIAIPTLLAFTAWIYGLMGTCGDVCYEVVSEAGFAGVKDYMADGKPTIARCELCVQRNWDADFHKVREESCVRVGIMRDHSRRGRCGRWPAVDSVSTERTIRSLSQ